MVRSDAELEWGTVSNGKLSHLFISSKTAALVPELCGGRPAFGRTAALVPEFAVEDLPSAELESRFLRLQ